MSKKLSYETFKFIELAIVCGLVYFWYNIVGVILKAVSGEAQAGISLLLGIMTWVLTGNRISKYIR